MKFYQIALRLCLFISLMIFAGCATSRPLGAIPKEPQDFILPFAELKAKFPELAVYEKKDFSLGYRTPVQDVIDQWGEPNNKSVQWWRPHGLALPALIVGGVASGGIEGPLIGAGIVLGMFPVPVMVYIWEKGDYLIDVYVDSSILGGYMKRLWYWEWKYKEKGKSP